MLARAIKLLADKTHQYRRQKSGMEYYCSLLAVTVDIVDDLTSTYGNVLCKDTMLLGLSGVQHRPTGLKPCIFAILLGKSGCAFDPNALRFYHRER